MVNPRRFLVAASAALLVMFASVAWAQPAGNACQNMSLISGTATTTGDTNGIPGVFFPGDTITISGALGTATAASFHIAGNSTGIPILAGPANAPVTLTYTVPGSGLPPGSIGVGWYVDSTNGTLVITASCVNVPPAPVPTMSSWGLAVLALMLAGSTLLYLRRRAR